MSASLPNSIESELAILSLCILSDPTHACVELQPHDFYKTSHRTIFKAIKDINASGGHVDLVTLVTHLKSNPDEFEKCGGAAFISGLVDNVPSPSGAQYYCDIIKEKSIKRQLIHHHNEIIKACMEDQPMDRIASECEKASMVNIPEGRDQVLMKVERWIKSAPGEFSFYDIDRDFDFKDPFLKELRTKACEKLVTEGYLQRSGGRRGWYRPVEGELVCQDISGCDDRPSNLWLPFNLSRMVDIFERNIVTIGGEKNAGKTSLLLNIAWANRNSYQVHYFNSEMGNQELRRRLSKFEGSDLNEWSKIRFYERARNFSDIIFPGPNDLNIIDFLELSDEFWKVGQLIRDIHDNLGSALAVIAMQKKTGSDNPRGGEFVKEKSRLHLDLINDSTSEYRHKLKINPGKNWHTDQNPNGKQVRFKIVQGNRLIPQTDSTGSVLWFEDDKRQQRSKI